MYLKNGWLYDEHLHHPKEMRISFCILFVINPFRPVLALDSDIVTLFFLLVGSIKRNEWYVHTTNNATHSQCLWIRRLHLLLNSLTQFYYSENLESLQLIQRVMMLSSLSVDLLFLKCYEIWKLDLDLLSGWIRNPLAGRYHKKSCILLEKSSWSVWLVHLRTVFSLSCTVVQPTALVNHVERFFSLFENNMVEAGLGQRIRVFSFSFIEGSGGINELCLCLSFLKSISISFLWRQLMWVRASKSSSRQYKSVCERCSRLCILNLYSR